MVHLKEQPIICLDPRRKFDSQVAPRNATEIAKERVYGTHLKVISKMDLRLQIDKKSEQLKKEN